MEVPHIEAAAICAGAVRQGRTIFICGNGGSAAMASHFAAECVVRYERTRRAIPCLSLSADQAVLTACANDLGYEQLFSRQLEALAKEGDVLICLTTSGKSKNILRAHIHAEAKGMIVLSPDPRRSDESTGDCQERHLHWLHGVAFHLENNLLTFHPELPACAPSSSSPP